MFNRKSLQDVQDFITEQEKLSLCVEEEREDARSVAEVAEVVEVAEVAGRQDDGVSGRSQSADRGKMFSS